MGEKFESVDTNLELPEDAWIWVAAERIYRKAGDYEKADEAQRRDVPEQRDL